jgi:hypothetical protein
MQVKYMYKKFAYLKNFFILHRDNANIKNKE